MGCCTTKSQQANPRAYNPVDIALQHFAMYTHEPVQERIENKEDASISLRNDTLYDGMLVASTNTNTNIQCIAHLKSCIIQDCNRCTFLIWGVKGSIYVRECKDCTIYSLSSQLRVRGCHDCRFHSICPTGLAIERCDALTISPLRLRAVQDDSMFMELADILLTTIGLSKNDVSYVVDFSNLGQDRRAHVYDVLEEPFELSLVPQSLGAVRFTPINDYLVDAKPKGYLTFRVKHAGPFPPYVLCILLYRDSVMYGVDEKGMLLYVPRELCAYYQNTAPFKDWVTLSAKGKR